MGSKTPVSPRIVVDLFGHWSTHSVFLIFVFCEDIEGRPAGLPEGEVGWHLFCGLPTAESAVGAGFGGGGHPFVHQCWAKVEAELCANAAPDIRLTVAPEISTAGCEHDC